MKLFFVFLVSMLLLVGCAQNASQTAKVEKSFGAMDVKKVAVNTTTSGKAVKIGDAVSVDYVGTLKDGKMFDTSLEAEAKKGGLPLRPSYAPLEFQVGAGQMIKGFDNGVIGMKVGEEKTVNILPADAYGEFDAQLIQQVPIAVLKENGIEAQVGMKLYTNSGAVGKIVALKDGNATVDFNHELAGKELVFKIILRKIK